MKYFIFILLATTSLFAAPITNKTNKIASVFDQPLTNGFFGITATGVYYSHTEKCFVLSNNVCIADSNYKLTADNAKSFMNPITKEWDKAVVVGRARLITKEYVVSGHKAVWSKTKREIVISGSPKVVYKNDYIATGELIRYDISLNKIHLEGKNPKKRARIVIPSSVLNNNKSKNFFKKK